MARKVRSDVQGPKIRKRVEASDISPRTHVNPLRHRLRAREGRRGRCGSAPSRPTGSRRLGGAAAAADVADSIFVIFRIGATMELGRSGRPLMMMSAGAGAARPRAPLTRFVVLSCAREAGRTMVRSPAAPSPVLVSGIVVRRFGGGRWRSGAAPMLTSASPSGGDGGVAGSLSEVRRPTGSSTATAKFCSIDGSRVSGVLSLWHFRLARSRSLSIGGWQPNLAIIGKTRRALTNRPCSCFVYEESDFEGRLRVSNWIVQRLYNYAVKRYSNTKRMELYRLYKSSP